MARYTMITVCKHPESAFFHERQKHHWCLQLLLDPSNTVYCSGISQPTHTRRRWSRYGICLAQRFGKYVHQDYPQTHIIAQVIPSLTIQHYGIVKVVSSAAIEEDEKQGLSR
jgi:hypothetical protein